MRTVLLCLLAHGVNAEPFPVSRCVNLDQALEAPAEGDWGYVITRPDINWIADQGFDTIRLPVKFSAHWDGSLDPALLRRVDEVLAWAIAVDLQIILDLHHFDEIHIDPAAHADKFAQIWTELSRYYTGYDDRLMFELLNEPSDNLTTDKAVSLYQAVYPTIREDHPERWIIIEGEEWAAISALPHLPVMDDKTALSFHYYTPHPFTHQLAPWMDHKWPADTWGDETDQAQLRDDIALAASRNAPLLLGEFGVTTPTDLTERIKWTTAVRKEAERHGIGWCHWGFAGNFAIFDQDTQDWVPRMQEALMSGRKDTN